MLLVIVGQDILKEDEVLKILLLVCCISVLFIKVDDVEDYKVQIWIEVRDFMANLFIKKSYYEKNVKIVNSEDDSANVDSLDVKVEVDYWANSST